MGGWWGWMVENVFMDAWRFFYLPQIIPVSLHGGSCTSDNTCIFATLSSRLSIWMWSFCGRSFDVSLPRHWDVCYSASPPLIIHWLQLSKLFGPLSFIVYLSMSLLWNTTFLHFILDTWIQGMYWSGIPTHTYAVTFVNRGTWQESMYLTNTWRSLIFITCFHWIKKTFESLETKQPKILGNPWLATAA